MIQDVYDNADTVKKQIAYFSLAWDVENCIPGFIQNLAKENITQAVIDAHKIPKEWAEHSLEFETQITDLLKTNTNYNSIAKPTPEEREIARRVGTNLTSLSKQQVDCLIKQAECLTELQVKLYCPSLIS